MRLREAQAQAVEQQVARMQAELVPVREVAKMLERWVVGFRARLLAIVDRLAGRFTAEQLECGRRELLATLDGLCEMRDEWRARADEVDRRRASPLVADAISARKPATFTSRR